MRIYFWNTMLDILTALNRLTERAWLWAYSRRERLGPDYEDLTQ